jgi:hypothetical protein
MSSHSGDNTKGQRRFGFEIFYIFLTTTPAGFDTVDLEPNRIHGLGFISYQINPSEK